MIAAWLGCSWKARTWIGCERLASRSRRGPRSNRYVGVGSPPLEVFYAMDVEVAFGTDSLASVEDLNMFAELAEARRIAPKVSARALLRSATLAGATALGFGDHFQHRTR